LGKYHKKYSGNTGVDQQVDRREFGKKMLSLAATAIVANNPLQLAFAKAPAKNSAEASSLAQWTFLSGHRGYLGTQTSTSNKNYLALGRSGGHVTQLVPVETDIHSVITNPKHPSALLSIAKNQPISTYFRNTADFRDQEIVQAARGQIFSGHGAFSENGSLLVTSETNSAKTIGVLVIRDGKTLRVLDQIDSGGLFPHELKFIDSNTVLVANGGGPEWTGSNLSLVNINDKKVLEVHTPPQFGPGCRHLALTEQGQIIVGTWITYSHKDSTKPFAQILTTRLSAPKTIQAIDLTPKQLSTFKEPPYQYLSVGIHPQTNLAVLTASNAEVVVVADISKSQIVKVLPLQKPSGVIAVPDTSLVAVSSAEGFTKFLDMRSMEWRTDLHWHHSLLSGSHLAAIKIG